MTTNLAIDLLGNCEHGLRKLVAQAAAAGDYSSVLRITDWARAVAAMMAEGKAAQAPVTTERGGTSGSPGSAAPAGECAARAGSPGSGAAPAAGATARGRARTRPEPGEYPQFFRRGDELVKVGWSKTDRKPYQHRAPRRAIDAMVAAVKQVGARGKVFPSSALLPLKSAVAGGTAGGGDVLPDYQAYTALAWLKHLGLVEQHGRRGGYTLVPDKQIDSTITAAWLELSDWRG